MGLDSVFLFFFFLFFFKSPPLPILNVYGMVLSLLDAQRTYVIRVHLLRTRARTHTHTHTKIALAHGRQLTNFEGEAIEATPFCERLKKDYPTLTITCVLIEGSFSSGYGVSKVVAVKHAPLDEVLWFDCDVLPIRDPDYLFEDPHFQTTGAAFWGDVEGHYHPERVVKLLDVSIRACSRVGWWYTDEGNSAPIHVCKCERV